MTNSLRAEWLKLVTTRTFRGLLVGAAIAGLLAAFIGTAQGPPPWSVDEPMRAGTGWYMATLVVTVLAVLLGSRIVSDEFSHETIVHTFVADPGRRRSMLSKSAVAAFAGMVVAVVTAAVLAGTAYAMAAITGGDLAVFRSDSTAVLGLIAGAAVMGVIGTALGAVVRHPVPAMAFTLLWLFVVENLTGILAGPLAAWLPGRLPSVLAGVPQDAGAPSLSAAGLAMGAYLIVVTAVGLLEIRRRDVL